jgi:phosphate transport system permease protein
MRSALLSTVIIALVPLTLIIGVTLIRGFSAIDLNFFTENPPFNITEEGGGYAPAFVGSAYMVGIAILLSVPLGIMAAVYLVEYKEERLTGPIQFFTDVMTGVPSVFVGLFVYAALVVDADLGFGTLPGAVALAILMLPIVVRSSEEILKLVPSDLRNAAYGLGARRWQVVTRVVLPAATPGLVTGSMLAVARAIGETAPLLITALGAQEIVLALTGRPQGSLTLQAFSDARTFAEPANARGWAGALCLMVITLVLTIAARYLSARKSVL